MTKDPFSSSFHISLDEGFVGWSFGALQNNPPVLLKNRLNITVLSHGGNIRSKVLADICIVEGRLPWLDGCGGP